MKNKCSKAVLYWIPGLRSAIGLFVMQGLILAACANSVPPMETQLPPSPTPSPPIGLPNPTVTQKNTPTSGFAIGLPDPSGYSWQPVIFGLELPVDIQNAGDGSGRLFVVEKPGRIRIFQNGQLLSAPFLDIQARVGSQSEEQGLLGLAFHPRYVENGLFFVNYTDLNGDTVIARFEISASDSNRADPAAEVRLLHIEQPFANHNGGQLAFGPDGYLYIGMGDGGSGGDPHGNSQSLDTLLGKLLRIDVDRGEHYAIPPDNPFPRGGGLPEIWAYGLRNPWRFSFDRQTGDLYISDVGQDKWEEINFLPAGSPGGANLGWNYYEGNHTFKGQALASTKFVSPVVEYPHGGLFAGQMRGCSVTGGIVYRGVALPDWQGVYLFGDFCTESVFGLIRTGEDSWQAGVLFDSVAAISAFGMDEAGEVYLADYYTGGVYRLGRP